MRTEKQEIAREAEERAAARRRTPETALIVDALVELLEDEMDPAFRERVEVALVGYSADLGKVERSALLALEALFSVRS